MISLITCTFRPQLGFPGVLSAITPKLKTQGAISQSSPELSPALPKPKLSLAAGWGFPFPGCRKWISCCFPIKTLWDCSFPTWSDMKTIPSSELCQLMAQSFLRAVHSMPWGWESKRMPWISTPVFMKYPSWPLEISLIFAFLVANRGRYHPYHNWVLFFFSIKCFKSLGKAETHQKGLF